jgi:Phosphotransferase enzyme family
VPHSLLERLETIPETGLQLRRAWPRNDRGLTLEYVGGGDIVAGQWLPDAVATNSLARKLGEDRATVADAAGEAVVLQRPGVDRKLPWLATAAAGGRVLAHRAERRATVATPGAFVKVLRPAGAAKPASVHRFASARAAGVVIPRVLAVDDARGTFELEPLPGRSLHDLLGAADATPHLEAVGAALAAFHGSGLPTGAGHGPREEAAVVKTWLDRLRPFDPELHALVQRESEPVLAALAALRPTPPAMLHRDLHDKQIFITPHGVGLIDLDTSSPGDPALDLGNLLAHLRLRAWQSGRDDGDDSGRVAFLEGYGADRALRERVEVYERGTALRLACVYAFRPRWGRSLLRELVGAAARPAGRLG